jgi:hypothetical protein
LGRTKAAAALFGEPSVLAEAEPCNDDGVITRGEVRALGAVPSHPA